MKKLLLIFGMAAVCGGAFAQVARDAQIPPASQPVYNPFQVPNYYQNNSSYNNNSIQNNPPARPNPNAFPGNGNYVDPTRTPANVPNQGPSPLYTPNPNNPLNTNTTNR